MNLNVADQGDFPIDNKITFTNVEFIENMLQLEDR